MDIRIKRLAPVLIANAAVALISAGYAIVAQSNAGQNTAASKEWPTYGHDPGGESNDAARHQWRDVYLDPVQPCRRAGSDDRAGDVGIPGPIGRAVDAR